MFDFTKYSIDWCLKRPGSEGIEYNESVMLIAEKNGAIEPVRLLFDADEIISFRDASLNTEYAAGKDFVLEEGKLCFPSGTRVQHIPHEQFFPSEPIEGGSFPAKEGGHLLFGEGDFFHKRQLAVSYRHRGSWDGPGFASKKRFLPLVSAKLEAKKELSVVYLGDSITVGANSSGLSRVFPYVPIWPDMVSEALENHYGAHIKSKNIAVGGTASAWGIAQAKDHGVAERPDLMLIAFGMNDGGSVPAAEFAQNLGAIMSNTKKSCPECEFLLVISMLHNPLLAWPSLHGSYEPVVAGFEGEGVAVADMASVHRRLLERKRYYDMTGNNVNHPNDYLARMYAIAVSSALF